MKRSVGKLSAVALLALFNAGGAFAAPVEFDLDGAHVLVVRPVDLWSGNRDMQERSLESVRERRVSYAYYDQSRQVRYGSRMGLMFRSDAPVSNTVKSKLDELKTELVSNDSYFFTVLPAVSLTPSEFRTLVEVQERLFDKNVLAQGNPATLQSRVSTRKFIGNALALVALAASIDKLGAVEGANFALGSGLSEDAYKLAYRARHVAAPLRLPAAFATGEFTRVDVRRVFYQNDVIGQVVIAYRGERTTDLENAALSGAIVTLTGADTTADEVEKARREDLAARQAVWDACVADGKCKGD